METISNSGRRRWYSFFGRAASSRFAAGARGWAVSGIRCLLAPVGVERQRTAQEEGSTARSRCRRMSSAKNGRVYGEHPPAECRTQLLRRVFEQVIELIRRVRGLPFLPPHLVNPSRDGGGGVPRFVLPFAAGGGPSLLDSRFRTPLSLGELDDFDSRVCAHVG